MSNLGLFPFVGIVIGSIGTGFIWGILVGAKLGYRLCVKNFERAWEETGREQHRA
jgi:hypothetical protein